MKVKENRTKATPNVGSLIENECGLGQAQYVELLLADNISFSFRNSSMELFKQKFRK